MSRYLVIVESPAKARTISKFLSSDYVVESSVGHIRDLPEKASEIPAAFKSEGWARLGVDVDNDFQPLYVVNADKKKKVKELAQHLKKAEVLFLATDEDREGESISWHLVEVLNPKVKTQRLVFHEITRKAIEESLEHPRDIDMRLVQAQETRRILDRLFGYEVSPLLWKKIGPKLSAGRVQSIGLLLIVRRERLRMSFRSAEFWDLEATFAPDRPSADIRPEDAFGAQLVSLDGKRVAGSKDFDPATGRLKNGAREVVLVEAARARQMAEDLSRGRFEVISVEKKPFTQKPPAPFTTSTLQQEGGRKHRFSAKVTMSLAQRLYENGYITYMRTDSTTLSNQALSAARSAVTSLYGGDYLPDEPRVYRTKVKNAQEAHEAIRPAGEAFRQPQDLRGELSSEELAIYDMIWKRTVASQMKDATGYRVTLRAGCDGAVFSATGRVVEFPGFFRAYVEGSDSPEADLADRDRLLPAVAKGDRLQCLDLKACEHHTQAPPRLTEAALIKELESNGIGRPSTWASVIDTILQRRYATKVSGALVPSFTAFAVVNLLEEHFSELVEIDFTARMEDDLDAISRGEAESVPYLKRFYFGNGAPGLKQLLESKSEIIDPREVCTIPIGEDAEGQMISIRVGRFGPFLERGEHTAPIPDGTLPDELTIERATELLDSAAAGPRVLGSDPETGRPVVVRKGRFGPYVQLEAEEGGKPKNASLLKGMDSETIDLETGLALLTLPRELGEDAQGHTITAHNGKYGPYIKCNEETRSLGTDDDVLKINRERALELLAEEKKGRGRNASREPLRVLGKASALGDVEIRLMKGRYGPYVTDGETNASLRSGDDPETIDLDQAVDLILRRREKGGNKKAPARKKSSKKAAKKTAKKATTAPAAKKKAAAKKTAKKKVTPRKSAKKKAAAKKTGARKAATGNSSSS